MKATGIISGGHEFLPDASINLFHYIICRKVRQIRYESIFRGENLANVVKATDKCTHRIYLLMKNTVEILASKFLKFMFTMTLK